MAAKSYILKYMWTAANFIIEGRRLYTVDLNLAMTDYLPV